MLMTTMCDYEEFIFTCNCSIVKLKSYCHKARNNRLHHCTFVKKLRCVWDLDQLCDQHRMAGVESNSQNVKPSNEQRKCVLNCRYI